MKLFSTKNLKRNGFTLIELLVAVTIFVILTALAIGSFNLNIGNERVRSASRQLQATLEGARSRAFKLQQPVGVRFIFDDAFPGEVSALLLVSSVSDAGGNLHETGRLRFVDLATDGDPNMVAPNDKAIQYVPSPNSISWGDMKGLDMLRAGMRIRIPAETGTWYTIASDKFLQDSNQRVMRLVETPLDQNNFSPVGGNYTTNGTSSAYEIDLTGVMVPLQGEEAVSLPRGVVIDLRSSKVPSNWRINRWQANISHAQSEWVAGVTSSSGLRLYRSENAGISGMSEPNWSSAANVDNTIVDNPGADQIVWRCYESPQFDVIFTPQGTLYGPVAAEGLLHFTIAETRDTRAVFENDPTTTPAGGTSVGILARDLRDRNGDGERPDHVGSYRIITVFGASGSVNVSPIDQSTDISPADGFADNIFNFAIQGDAAK